MWPDVGNRSLQMEWSILRGGHSAFPWALIPVDRRLQSRSADRGLTQELWSQQECQQPPGGGRGREPSLPTGSRVRTPPGPQHGRQTLLFQARLGSRDGSHGKLIIGEINFL